MPNKEAPRRDEIGRFASKKDVPSSKKFPKKTVAGVTAIALVGALGYTFRDQIGNIFDNNGSDGSSTTTTSQPLAGTNDGTSTTTTIADTTTTAAATTTTTEGQPEGFQVSPEAEAFMAAWPKTAEEAATMFGGDASQWERNPEWSDSRTFESLILPGLTGLINREWIPTDVNNLPFYWPQTPEEAAEYFFPGQNVDPRFVIPAYIDSETGMTVAWEKTEDEWIIDGKVEVTPYIPAGSTGEGYTVKTNRDSTDDRNYVFWGGYLGENGQNGILFNIPVQGITIWAPGRANPQFIAGRMEPFQVEDTPHYGGSEGEQLGPDAINFPPAYPAPKNNG